MKITGLVLVIVALYAAAPSYAQDQLDFAHDILPVLRSRCASCHSNGTYKGGFSIDTRQAILDTGAVDTTDPEESELLHRISSEDDDYRMPPEGEPLSPEQFATFRKWIAEDMAWQAGFSFRQTAWKPPIVFREADVPPGVGNPIDRIVARYFERNDIQPPELVSDSVFIRRAYLDVVGILPTIAEQDAFEENTDELKREQLIDSLLSRKRDYADHWLTFWNDLLRNDYAGTGYIDGGRKQITRWLHRSLHNNMPYDQFVRELISPSEESDGFIRGIQWRGDVNASQTREMQFAQNLAQVFLGENLKCASCHDSFVDDWKLADAWSLAAIISDHPLEMVRCDQPTGQLATPGFLWPQLGNVTVDRPAAERLEELAQLIAGKNNGRLARTISNRIWQRLMGRAIIEPVDVMGNQPFDADLIDFLACYLRDNHYDVKKLIRLIATSQTWQQQSIVETAIPDGKIVFRGPVMKRKTAEQFCDNIWNLTNTAPESPNAEIEETGQSGIPIRAALVVSDGLMRDLGRPNREQVVTTRSDRLSTLQTLELSNGQALSTILNSGARRLLELNMDRDLLVIEFFRSALCRHPTPDEVEALHQIIGEQPNTDSVADLIWTVIMLPEFQYVH